MGVAGAPEAVKNSLVVRVWGGGRGGAGRLEAGDEAGERAAVGEGIDDERNAEVSKRLRVPDRTKKLRKGRPNRSISRSIAGRPPIGKNALSRPIRVDRPPARMHAARPLPAG
ncbi:hypothetical protein ABG088_07825, partial [Hydrogenibacillus schlegelii]